MSTHSFFLSMTIVLIAAFTSTAQQAAHGTPYDLVIRGGTIVDGGGKPAFVADIGIIDDSIVEIGDLSLSTAKRTIDAKGLVVAPGFIDLHSHSDQEILEDGLRRNQSYLTQGCTTVVTGNCGMGHVDVAKYFASFEKHRGGTNIAHLLPHGSIRERAMKGSFERAPTAEEMSAMKAMIEKGMADGAFGMSTGLIYTPGSFSTTEELIELAKTVAASGGIYASHIRGEGDRLIPAVAEALRIGKEAKIQVQISHFKAVGPANWGKIKEAARMIEEARAAGQVVFADQYPYTASSTSLSAMLIPEWARAGTRQDMLKRFVDATDGPRIREAVKKGLEERGGAQTIQIASYSPEPELNGLSLLEASERKKTPTVDLVIDLLSRAAVGAVSFGMREDDVRWAMQKDWVACASDGSSSRADASKPHPRSYGTFPRRIGRYAIDEKVGSLESAVRASSGLPADILRLERRGYLRVGSFADVVVFDPKTFRDTSTYADPHKESLGVRYIFVNGVMEIDDGKPVDHSGGRVLKREHK